LALRDAVNFTPINSARLAAIDVAAFAEVEAQWAFALRELRREHLHFANEPEPAHLPEQFTCSTITLCMSDLISFALLGRTDRSRRCKRRIRNELGMNVLYH
jgi:hypothetical protein